MSTKIALPTKDESVDNHFGHCEKFTVYTVSDDKKVVEKSFYEAPKSCGCKSNLAAELANEGVSVLIAGGIGQGAVNKLKESGIEVFMGFQGETQEVVERWLGGEKGNYSICPPHDHDGHNCHNN